MATTAPVSQPVASDERTGRPRRRKLRRTDGMRWQVWFIIVMLCLWEGFPFPLIGLRNVVGYQAFAAIVFLGTPIYFFRAAIRRFSFTYWDFLPLLLFFICVAASVFYSGILVPAPLREWLPAIYTIAPVLLIFPLKAIGANLRDAEKALYYSGIFASLLVIVNGFAELHILDFYVRGSGFGTENRVVFFKLEATFALVIALLRLVYARKVSRFLGAGLATFITFYNVFVLSESRLAIAAVLISLALSWLFVMGAARKLFFLLLAPLVAVPVIAFVIEKYLRGSDNMSTYMSNDVSAKFRATENVHFGHYFDGTSGIGFGFMSGNAEYNNIIAYSANRAGYAYGTRDYGLSLDDIGIYSALYQYGYAGLIVILLMTGLAVWSLARSTRLGPDYASIAAVGMLMLAFMFSPISMNYFTLFYTAHLGGLLWFMAASVPRLQRKPRPSGRRAAPA